MSKVSLSIVVIERDTDWSAAGSERDLWTFGEVLFDVRQLRDLLAVRNKRGIGGELLGGLHEREELEHVPYGQKIKVCKC